jgi:membrane fusion protein (multidrug efflux system)
MASINRLVLPIFMSLIWLMLSAPVFSQDTDPYGRDYSSFGQEPIDLDQAQALDNSGGFECLLKPFLTVKIGSSVPGALSEVRVKRGDIIKKNQVVAMIDTRVQLAGVVVSETRYDYAQRRLVRSKDLVKENFLSSQETDELETNALMAKQELTERKTQVEIRSIRSPLSGVVVERFKGPGEYVQETEILELAQIDPLNVELILPVKYFGSIQPGMVADVIPQQPVGGSYQAKVKVIDKVIDAASGTFGVVLEIPNPGNKIPAGLRCEARFADLELAAAN